MSNQSHYLEYLRSFAHQEELKKVRTLAMSYSAVLDTFPRVREHFESLLATKEVFDGDALVTSLTPKLEALTSLANRAALATRDLRPQLSSPVAFDELICCVQRDADTMTVHRILDELAAGTANLKFQADQERQRRINAENERKRREAEAEAKRRAEAEEEKRKKQLAEEDRKRREAENRRRQEEQNQRRLDEQRRANAERHQKAADERQRQRRAEEERKHLEAERVHKAEQERQRRLQAVSDAEQEFIVAAKKAKQRESKGCMAFIILIIVGAVLGLAFGKGDPGERMVSGAFIGFFFGLLITGVTIRDEFSSREWSYLSKDGKKETVKGSSILDLILKGEIRPTTQVWHSGLEEWEVAQHALNRIDKSFPINDSLI